MAALIDFGRAMFTSHVQSKPQCSRDQADNRKQTHHADVIKSDSGGDQGLDCGPVVIVIFPLSLIASMNDQGLDGIYQF